MRLYKEESGVSESIGFVIIFSLVMIGIGLITLYGYPILLKQQSVANVRNMERDMIILQNDVKALAYKNIPYKETSLQVAGGSLKVYGYDISGSEFEITVKNSSSDETYKYKTGQLRYESDSLNDVIVLENGAVMTRQKQSTGSAMLAEPRWFIDTVDDKETFTINIIQLDANAVMSRSGIGTVKMRVNSIDYYETPDDWGPWEINVIYRPDSDYNFCQAWYNYLTKPPLSMSAAGSCSGNVTNVTYTRGNLTRVVMKVYEIEVQSI